MKKIGIDARLYFKTGVGVYIRNLLYYLQEIAPKGITFYIYILSEDSSKITFTSPNFVKSVVPYKWHTISEQVGFLTTLYRDNLDLMHFTYFSYPVLYKRKFIATIHDTILFEHKTGKASTKSNLIYEIKHFFFRYVFLSQLKNAQSIITPTDTVKKNIIKLFGPQYEAKITTIYEGVDHELSSAIENKKLEQTHKERFFIYVGNYYPHKNVERLVKVFAQLPEDLQLILIGPKDYFSDKLSDYIKSLNQSERIVFAHNIPAEDLVYYYKHAQALIHPSRAEGFGIPLIEAAYFGLPVIAADIEVFKELLGDKYIPFNPTDEDSMKKTIESFIQDERKFDYSDIIKKFSFKKMTDKILELYLKNLNNNLFY